jgi:D-arabinose 5-phosphate isomerase GutQ
MLDKCELILGEIEKVLNSSSFDQYKDFMESILNANKIVVFGAGRVGIAMRGFSMRLNHLGLKSFFLGDVNVPNTGVGDLLRWAYYGFLNIEERDKKYKSILKESKKW